MPILPVPGKDASNDLPRKPPAPDPRIDREALIGDARNDENLVIAQMQVAFLRVRNLLRGYLLRMPTGQAVAKKLKITPLTASQIEKAASSPAQKTVLRSSGFNKRTPLWFYVLAEAAAIGDGRLGPVGSTIVAEVLVALARRSESSIFDEPGWKPTLGAKKGKFIINDLLKLAGEL